MSDTLGSFNYSPEHISFIQNEIKNYLECDDVLSEYIIVMVRNNKTKKDISGDLADFLSTDTDSFVNWLWNFIKTYFAQQMETSSTTSDATNQNEPKKPTARLLANALKQATEDTKNAIPDAEFEDVADAEAETNGHNRGGKRSGKKPFNTSKYNNSNSSNSRNTKSPPTSLKVTFSTENRKRKINESADDATITEVIAEEATDDASEVRFTKKSDKKERCQFWPLCKNGEACPYYHPTIQCNLFPKCPYGEKCLYIHPSIPNCKFGVGCTNLSCQFNHPQRPMYDTAIPCRNGFACPNKKFCSFSHPPLPCKYGETCPFVAQQKKCHFGHGRPCMYGVACTTPNCTFTHYSATDVVPAPKECKFGKECTNANCKFLHPERENTEQLSNTLPSTPPQLKEEQLDDAPIITEPIKAELAPEVTF